MCPYYCPKGIKDDAVEILLDISRMVARMAEDMEMLQYYKCKTQKQKRRNQ